MEQNKKILIIIGSAPCVGSDIAAAALLLPTLLPSVNPASLSLIPVPSLDPCTLNLEPCFMLIGLDAVDKCLWPAKYFATYHPYEISEAKDRRVKAGGNTDFKIISNVQHDGLVDIIIPLIGVPSGSSALLGVHAGMKEGYKKIIVCGCPLTGKNDKGDNYEVFRLGWTAKQTEIKDVVRSMSGWTRELLGAPTTEWLVG